VRRPEFPKLKVNPKSAASALSTVNVKSEITATKRKILIVRFSNIVRGK
jgi:hypothetical protein